MRVILLTIFIPFFCFASIFHEKDHVDSYTLALTWLPGKCKINSSFPECKAPAESHFFTLHGLWPEHRGCGIDYSFCASETKNKENFCDYAEISLSSATHANLLKYMPSVKYNGCLDRHEWFKHGTCTRYESDQYFKIALNYLHQFNASRFASYYLKMNIGRKIAVKDFYHYFDIEFGDNAHKNVRLMCKNNYLYDLLIQLPEDIRDGRTELRKLIRHAKPSALKSNCGDNFIFEGNPN